MSIGTSPGETVGDSIPDGGGGGSIIPDWIWTPRVWLATVLIGWLFDLWEAILGFIDKMWSVLAGIPQAAIYEPLTSAFAPTGTAIQNLWRDIGTIAVDVSEAAGPFAPIVVVAVWLIPALLAISVLYFLWGFVQTYLPVEGIPVLRRFA